MASSRFEASPPVRLACTFLFAVAVCLPAPATGRSWPAPESFHDWLASLRALVKKNVSCFFAKGAHDVLLSDNVVSRWGGKVASSKNWKDYRSTNVNGVQFTAKHGGVLVASFNGHLGGSGTFHARFTFGNVTQFPDDWGAYYIHPISSYLWAPVNFVQMITVPCASSSNNLKVRLQTRSPGQDLNSPAFGALFLPPPSFLSSIQSSAISLKSGQAPVGNFVHKITVSSKKALLIMAANGRIKGKTGQGATSLTYAVDGHSPTKQHGKDYGYYHVTKAATATTFIRVGLHQLAEVNGGSHKIQLNGKGSDFDLQYATSQVAVIPLDSVQLKTKTADWTMAVNYGTRKTLLTASVVATEDSVLVLAASFEVSSKCKSYHAYLQFALNGSIFYPSSWNSTVSRFSFLAIMNIAYPYPGSLLQFTKVKEGTHRVGLSIRPIQSCTLFIQRAALQVGVIPHSF